MKKLQQGKGTRGVRVLIGDCRERLKELPDASVHTCVTSPPYFGLRDYGTATWEGGDPKCKHRGIKTRTVSGALGLQRGNKGSQRVYSGDCKCGAVRVDLQIGLESNLEDYVNTLVEVFREVHRVLRNDGTLWLNLGDMYKRAGFMQRPGIAGQDALSFKPKDLIGVPWRVAFALQNAGWYLRQDIIWNKPNPMPEAVRDRCTKSHEYIFLFSKQEHYYFDSDVIAEPIAPSQVDRVREDVIGGKSHVERGQHSKGGTYRRNPADDHRTGGLRSRNTRNKRSVWTVNTSPFPGAHFATFPPKLIEPCILAGAPKGGVVLDPFGGGRNDWTDGDAVGAGSDPD